VKATNSRDGKPRTTVSVKFRIGVDDLNLVIQHMVVAEANDFDIGLSDVTKVLSKLKPSKVIKEMKRILNNHGSGLNYSGIEEYEFTDSAYGYIAEWIAIKFPEFS